MKSIFLKSSFLFMILLLAAQPAWCHAIVAELEKMSGTETALFYLKSGYEHILPLGLDHILFVLGLFLLSPGLKQIIWQSTAFTVAHSITLGLAMYDVIAPPSAIIEPLISLSIVFIAVENIILKKVKASRMGMIFLFGLVHGLGFASALSDLGLPQKSFLTSLIMFNAGVELGQLTVILLAFFLVGKWFGKKPFYRKAIVVPASCIIIVVAGYWTIQRIFLS
jgi:hypothetical protein